MQSYYNERLFAISPYLIENDQYVFPYSHFFMKSSNYKIEIEASSRGAWLAQLVEQVTLDLGVMGLSPMLGAEMT